MRSAHSSLEADTGLSEIELDRLGVVPARREDASRASTAQERMRPKRPPMGNNILGSVAPPYADSRISGCAPPSGDSPGILGENPASGSPPGAIPPPWAQPLRLWSLLDLMTPFKLKEIYDFLMTIGGAVRRWKESPEGEEIPDDERKRLVATLKEMLPATREEAANGVIVEHVAHELARLIIWLDMDELTSASLVIHLMNLTASIQIELANIALAFIPAGKSKYFEQEMLFGEPVWKAFPSARADIREAGNCFATGAHTATVFHLMRAAEVALRVLATNLQVTFSDPIEFQIWDTIIDEAQDKANAVCKSLPSKKAKIEAREFYNGAIGEFRAFKEMRNPVMHTRRTYDEPMAQSAMNHVREFMQRLAKKLREGRRNPIKWK